MEKAVLLDVSGIQDYILGPRQLKMRRGASQLLLDFNRTTVYQVANQCSASRPVVFSNGGNGMAIFPDEDGATRFRREIARRLTEATAIATLRAASAEYDESRFPDTWVALQEAMAREKAIAISRFFPGSSPYWRICEECGQFPVVDRRQYPDGKYWFYCQACILRLARNNRAEDQQPTQRIPADFDEIASKAHPHGYLALVAIDLDGMGEYFSIYATRKSPGDQRETSGRDVCGEVSERIDKSVRAGVERACSSLDSSEVLLCGGDDCAVMIPANRIWDFLERFRDGFKEKFREPMDCVRDPLPLPQFSAGMAIAHSHFPISEFFRVAKELQRSAKRLKGMDSVDYEIISTSMSERPLDLRKRIADAGKQGLYRTAKPYALEGFLAFRDEIRELKTTAPANKITALYRIAYEGPLQSVLEYLRVLQRLDEPNRKRLCTLIGPKLWRTEPDGRVVTKAADLAELWEFVR